MQTTINEIDVNYEILGTGFPVIILHGFYLDHTPMIGACEPIFKNRSNYQRIYIDLPGMGKTPSTGITNSDDVLKIILDFIDTVIPNQQFLLIGLSYGGYLARGILRYKQEWVQGMMLLAPVIGAKTRNIPDEHVIYRDPQAIEKIPDKLQLMFLSKLAVQSDYVVQRIVDEFLGGMPKPEQMEFLEQLRQPENYALTEDVDNLLTPFDKPTLILTGRQDTSVGYVDAFSVANAYTRASYIALDRAGHGLHLEQDEIYTVLFCEWLNRVEEVQKSSVK